MLDTIRITLASVALLASTTIAGFPVTRSSLFGFAVQGPARVHVLELEEAAEILTRAARLASVAPAPAPASAPVQASPAPAPVASAPAPAPAPAALVMCRRCGILRAAPERHCAIGQIECPAGDREFFQAPPPADLLVAPRETSPGRFSETWTEGPAARRRYDALRRAFGAANVHKDTTRPRAEFGSAETATVEIRWMAPRGAVAPQIQGVQS